MILLSKNLDNLPPILMKWIKYSMILSEIVEINIFIHSNIDVYMISKLQILKLMKKLV